MAFFSITEAQLGIILTAQAVGCILVSVFLRYMESASISFME